jgi:hypothetical protein
MSVVKDAAYYRDYYKRNRAKYRRAVQKWKQANPDRVRAASHERYLEKREQILKANKTWRLKTNYGITPETYEVMREMQGGRCVICGTDKPRGNHGTLCIDHDHKTGKVRGLLCGTCNRALGFFKDSESLLIAAAEYIRKHKEQLT